MKETRRRRKSTGCPIPFIEKSRKRRLIYSDRENQGLLEMRLVFRNERERVYRSTRKKFGMVGISMILIVVII